jgi:hypothetical protein
MTEKLIRHVALAGFVLAATACQSMGEDALKTISAGHTGCTPDQITLSNYQHIGTLGTDETWNATCNGKVYLCSGVGASPSSAGSYSCAPAVK